jgi:sulfonate transport system substrate-binding protein
MTLFSRHSLFASVIAIGLLPSATLFAADKPKTINIDWATYNPVSMVLKEQGLLEKEFAKDGIGIRWVQTLGSNKALEFLNAGSIDLGSTAGSAALLAKVNGNPIKSIYVFSRPEWTALVTRKDTALNKIEDLKGKRVAVTRGTDPHIFLVRALQSVHLTEKDITPVLLQHPDGKTALIRGDVDAWAGLDPMMAQAEVEDGARLFYRNKEANTWGILNVREEFLKDHADLCTSRRANTRSPTTTRRSASSSPPPSSRARWSTSSSRSAPSSPTARSARRSVSRSWPPASRCSRPA